MDGEAFVAEVESVRDARLERLGADGLLLAITDGTLEADRVLSAAAASEHAAAETFHAWAADEGDDRARAAFADVAAQEEDHYERVVDRLDGFEPPTAPGPMHAYLRARTDTVDRIATGMVARPLVSVRTHARIVDFFVDVGEEAAADVFGDLLAETEAVVDVGGRLLEERCGPADWERATAAAEYLLQVAVDDHSDALTAQGGRTGDGNGPAGAGGRHNT